jgi:hypothetical protein
MCRNVSKVVSVRKNKQKFPPAIPNFLEKKKDDQQFSFLCGLLALNKIPNELTNNQVAYFRQIHTENVL